MGKSAIDLAGYAAGQTDTFRGTGVWSGMKFEREEPGKDDKNESKAEAPAPEKESEKDATIAFK